MFKVGDKVRNKFTDEELTIVRKWWDDVAFEYIYTLSDGGHREEYFMREYWEVIS